MTTVTVTGANGFIGKSLIPHLQKRSGCRVICLSGRNGQTDREKDRYSGDITCQKTFRSLPECDTIIHLAALTSYELIVSQPLKARENYLRGMENVLTYAEQVKAQRIVFLSSCKVYGNSPMPFREDGECLPTTVMGELKKEAEDLLMQYAERSGTDAVILRVSNVFGAMQSDRFLIPRLLDSCQNGTPLCLCDPGTVRNYVYIDDLLHAIDIALCEKITGCNIFNVAAAQSVSIGEIVKAVEASVGRKAVITVDKTQRPDETPAEIISSDKLRALGWKEEWGLENGIRRLLAR